MSRLPVPFTGSPLGFFFDNRNAGPVHLNIDNRNRFSHDDRQMKLQSPVHLGLLASGDLCADGFGGTFDGFGGDFETGE